MNRLFVSGDASNVRSGARFVRWALAVFVGCSLSALAQDAAPPENADAPVNVRATHVMGFQNLKSNCNGTLSIEGTNLQFHQKGKPDAEVTIASVRDVFLGAESKQVGGKPMMLGKAAAPYGGGRVVSLFAHKKYDILSLEYVDSDGGLHGAIFQLNKGQGEVLRNELVARGAPTSSGRDQSTK